MKLKESTDPVYFPLQEVDVFKECQEILTKLAQQIGQQLE